MNARSLPSEAPADPASPSLRLAPPEVPAGPRDPIAAWLDVLARLLRLPEAERAGIREELDTHLRDRTRDLMVTGLAEAEASARAISELGDTAVLAQRFNRAGRPPLRRKLMNLGMLAMTGVALVSGTLALSGPREDRIAVAVFDPAITREGQQAAEGRFDIPRNAPWSQIFEAAGKAAQLPVIIHWDSLLEMGGDQPIEPMSPSGLSGTSLTLPDTVALVNERFPGGGNGLDYRAADGTLVFASIDYFDRRETVLATYDLTGIVEARLRDADNTARQIMTQQVTEEVALLLSSLVFPEQWQQNGGDRAKLAIFGTKLFITAPKRFHPKIRWVLSELPSTAESQDPDRTPRTRAAAERDLKSLELKTRITDLQGQIAAIDSKRIELGQGEITPEIRKQQDALAEHRLKLALELDKLESDYSALWAASAGNQRELRSLERRTKAAQLKLEAIRTEYAQLDPLRTAGQISSTDAARRQAELMEEEAEVLDQIAEIENRRAELTGKPIVEGGSIRPDGTVVDEHGNPAEAIEVPFQPRMKVRPKPDAAAPKAETSVYHPERIGPGQLRDLLAQAFNTIPALQYAESRTLAVDESDGILQVTAPAEQIAAIGRLARAFDLPGPSDGADSLTTETFSLSTLPASSAASLIDLMYKYRLGINSPCIGHAVIADATNNRLVITSRPGHVEFIRQFASTADGQ